MNELLAPASRGRLGRHDLQAERLIGPFHIKRRGKGRDRREPPTQLICCARRVVPRSEEIAMPMPHRTFAQLAKRRLIGKEGRERVREVNALLAELPDYKNGPYADLRKWLASEIEESRVRSNAVHRDSIAVRREGAAQIALVGPPNVGKSSILQALVGDPDQDGRLPVHDAPPDPGAHPDRRRPRPARRDPRAHRGGATRTAAAAGRCSACSARPTRSSTARGPTPTPRSSGPFAPRWPRGNRQARLPRGDPRRRGLRERSSGSRQRFRTSTSSPSR